MPPSQPYSGTKAVDGTEWSLTTDTAGPDSETTGGTYQAWIDANDMVAGDIIQIRLYEKCTSSSDPQRLAKEWIFTGAQAEPAIVCETFILMHGWDFTAKALAGTITVLWSIRTPA
jgi:hypothetical protein